MRTKFSGILMLVLAFIVQFSFAQEKSISGTVTDDKGLPLPGVNVVVVNTSNGTQTDFDGNYTIKANRGSVLSFSYVGFQTKEIAVSDESVINVQLITDASELEEVVVVAYGVQRRSNVTSAIATVKSEEIENVPLASVDQVLQGRVAGVNISVGSGQPGQSGTIQLRGRSSILGQIEPLFVIDGVPVDEDNFRSLNANDIESLSVLKDASASALYGNRAAAGVIVITTKKGSYSKPLSVTYRSQYGVSVAPRANFDVMNTLQFLTFQNEIGAGLGASLTPAEIAQRAAEVNTDWTDVLLREGTTLNQELNLSAGTENLRTYNSVSYFEQEGLTLGSGLQRISLRNNVSAKTDRFNFGSNLTMNFSRNNFVVDRIRGNNTGGELDNPFLVGYLGLPYQSPFNPDGSINTVGDGTEGFLNLPYLALNRVRFNTDQEEEIKIVGSLNASYELIKNITVGGSVGADYNQVNFLSIISPNSLRGQSTPDANSAVKGSRSETLLRDLAININTNITYRNTFDDVHNVEVAAYTEYYKRSRRAFGVTGFGINPKLPNSIQGLTDGNTTEGADDTRFYIPTINGFSNDRGLFSVFGKVDYDYDNKYGIQLSVRRDASSRLSEENRWGTFYSVSGLWNIHKENFLSDTSIDELKLRGSYGVTGNQDLGDQSLFAAFDLYGLGTGYGGAPSFVPTQIGNPDLRWEETTQANIGVDFAFMQFRLTGSLDFYNKVTDDLFLANPLSLTSGFTTINSNVGKMSNKGVEISLSYDIIRNDNLTVNVYGNAAYNKNEIEELTGTDLIPTGQTAQAVGQPFGTYYLVRWAGVNPANGEPLYYDRNGNLTNQFSDDDRVLLEGKSSQPIYTGGFGLNIDYKGFSLTSLFSFAAEQYRTNGSLGVIEDTGLAGFSNMSTSLLRRWQQPGDITDIPAAGFNTRLQGNDRYLEDASFLRLRNIQLGYTLDGSKIGDNALFSSLRIYLQGQNLVTWSKWRGFDPESNTGSSFFDYPTPRIYTVGVDINL